MPRAAAARPDAGLLACKILFEDGRTIQYAGATFNARLGYSGRLTGYGTPDRQDDDGVRDVGRADGAALALSRAAFEQVGGLDESLFMYVEDVELSLRVRRAGFGVVFVPDARVRHKGSAASGGRASTTNLFYSVRNTIAVSERYAPLPLGCARLRRSVVVGAHLVQALSHPARRDAVACRGRRLAGGARRAQRAALTPTYDRSMPRRAFITGIGGQDGSLLAELLLDGGLRGGRCRPRSPRRSYPNLAAIADRIELIEADLNDRVSLARALQSCAPDEVYNLASVSFVPMSWEEPVLTAELAAVGATSLLEVIREVGAPIRFYQASSSEIFGEPVESPQRESTPVQPADAVRRREDVRPLHHAQLPAPLRDARLLRDPLQPHLAAAAVEFVPRKITAAAAAIKLGLQDELRLGDLSARRDWGYATTTSAASG